MDKVAKILVYYTAMLIFYVVLRRQYRRFKQGNGHKITISQIIIIALFIGLFSVISMSSLDTLDHEYYTHRFVNGWDISRDSFGLNLIFNLAHIFTNDANILNFFVNFLTTLVILIIYRKWDDFKPEILIVIFMSEYFLYDFQVMKQSLANVFSLCFLYCFFRGRKIASLVFIAIAVSFHEVALILIPLYCALLFSKQKWFRILCVASVPIVVVFYGPITSTIVEMANAIGLSRQINPYIDMDNNIIVNSNLFTVLKGVPFYTITITGLIMRKKNHLNIKKYDEYLMLCLTASVAVLLSAYMYWTFRIACLVFIPCLIFARNLLDRITVPKKKFLFKSLTFYLIAALGTKYMIQMFLIYGGL